MKSFREPRVKAEVFQRRGAVLPLIKVLVSHISAVKYQCIHDVDCTDSSLRLALRNEHIHTTTIRNKTNGNWFSSGFGWSSAERNNAGSFI